MKWMPRVISLLVLAFYLSLWIFNEDVRSRPTLPVILPGLLAVFLLVAWRWERFGGLLTILGGLIFFLVIIVGAIGANDISPMAALFGGALLAAPFLLTGCLFFIAGQQPGRSRGSKTDCFPAGSAQNSD